MGQSLKAVVQLLLIVFGIAALMFWLMPQRADALVWMLRVTLSVGTVGIAYLLFRVARRQDLAPDILRQQFGTYFERDGLCFVPVFTLSRDEGDACSFTIFFQNRYSGPCTCDLIVRPMAKSFRFKRPDVPMVAVQIECPGGAVGVTRIPYPIPREFQGQTIQYEVSAQTHYPSGAGILLRFREGIRVGGHQHALGQAAKTLGLAAFGVIYASRPATTKMTLPSDVPEASPPGATVITGLLWEWDEPTGGFPVGRVEIPSRRAPSEATR